jgi:hypothetical protein
MSSSAAKTRTQAMTPAPKPRRKRAELRELIITAGREILRSEGLGNGAERLTFKRVFDHLEISEDIKVTNASVIGRIWDNQEQFQFDVLMSLASDDDRSEFTRTIDAVLPILTKADLSTVDSRRAGLRELCRVGGAANIEALRDSETWPIWIGVWALNASTTLSSPIEIQDLLRSILESELADFTEIYASLFAHFGFQIKAGYTINDFTLAVSALAEGCALRDKVGTEQLRVIKRKTGKGNRNQEWTLFSIGLEALMEGFAEPIPRWSPPG